MVLLMLILIAKCACQILYSNTAIFSLQLKCKVWTSSRLFKYYMSLEILPKVLLPTVIHVGKKCYSDGFKMIF